MKQVSFVISCELELSEVLLSEMLHSGVSAWEAFVFTQALKEIFLDITCSTLHRPATNWSV